MVDDSNQTISQTDDQGATQVVGQSPVSAVDEPIAQPANQLPVLPVDEPATQPASQPAQNGGAQNSGTQKNPLDVLEQLLSEIDGGKGGPKAGSDPTVPEKTGPTPEEIAAEELERRRIDFEQKQAAQKIIDDQKIEEQRQVLADEMSNGVANVARAQQDEEKKIQQEEKQSADEGFEILQIDHTKI